MKNVVWWMGIEDPEQKEAFGSFEFLSYSKQSWQHFCERNGCEFVEFSKPVDDLTRFKSQWQKILCVFDELDKRGTEYDQIAIVDNTGIVRWDCPNFFNMTGHKFVAWRDIVNLQKNYDDINGLKDTFSDVKFDVTKYFDGGFMIFNASHKEVMNNFKLFYLTNQFRFSDVEDYQPLLNYWIQKHGVELNLELPPPFNLTHIEKSMMFGHNWTLNEDKTPFFLKYGWQYRFVGSPKSQINSLMKQTWDATKHLYSDEKLLDSVQHKDQYKNTTSRAFKQDILRYFRGKNLSSCLELGGSQGNTTKIYGHVFKNVMSVELIPENVEKSKKLCEGLHHIDIQVGDVYDSGSNYDFTKYDTIVIDAGHDWNQINYDLKRVYDSGTNAFIILDDYGNSKLTTIRKAFDRYVQEGKVEILDFLGEQPGYTTVTGMVLTDREGVVFKFKR
jgi:protein-L-isoaspartate O-methyltransferase